jgi:hypothetical protein
MRRHEGQITLLKKLIILSLQPFGRTAIVLLQALANILHNSILISWPVIRISESRDNATGYGLDDRGAIIFTSPRRPDRLWGPLSLLSNGYRGLFPLGAKRPGREVDHSPPTSADVKKRESIHPLPYKSS